MDLTGHIPLVLQVKRLRERDPPHEVYLITLRIVCFHINLEPVLVLFF